MNDFQFGLMVVTFSWIAYFSCFLAKKDMSTFDLAKSSYTKGSKTVYFIRRAVSHFVEAAIFPAVYFAIVLYFS
jgi:hypothetical protein